MKTNRIIRITGNVITFILSTILIISGILKTIGYEPYQNMIVRLSPHYFENIYLIGVTAIFAGALLAIPRTFTLGFITTLVFLGGTISAHMQIGDNFVPQIFFVALTVISALIKRPEWFNNKSQSVA